jgi:hypothetical protein
VRSPDEARQGATEVKLLATAAGEPIEAAAASDEPITLQPTKRGKDRPIPHRPRQRRRMRIPVDQREQPRLDRASR